MTKTQTGGLLAGVRVIESSLLGPAAVGMQLADLGAEVIKVENPGGDYVRKMAFPIIDGISLLHWHLNRGKQSIVLDLRTPEGVATYLELVRGADAVIEAMRPGALARRGITCEKMQEVNPRIVFCTHLRLRHDRPVQGHAEPRHRLRRLGRRRAADVSTPTASRRIPSYTTIGINAGPLYAALGICAAIIRARASGARLPLRGGAERRRGGVQLERHRGQQGVRAARGRGDRQRRRRQGAAPAGRRRQHERSRCATSTTARATASCCSWPRSASSGRTSPTASAAPSCTSSNPGAKYADHARGNVALRRELADDLRHAAPPPSGSRFGLEVNTPIAPVNDVKSITRDPQFQDRLPLRP